MDGLLDFAKETLRWDMHVVECGTYDGISTAVFAMFAGRVTTIDLDPHEAPLLKHLANVERVAGDSVASAARFADGSVDVVYLDTVHTYETVSREVEAWLPKIKRGGVIGGHDYSAQFVGVVQAVCEKFDLPDRVYGDSSWKVRLP